MRLLTSCALAAAVLSCDGVNIGLLNDDPGPPILVRLLIQDELPRGGRNVATDLLDKKPPLACDDLMPCPTGDQFSHPRCNLTTHVCPDPQNPKETPPAIGAQGAGTTSGNQIRLVLNKTLDPSIEVPTINMMTMMVSGYALVDPTAIGIFDAQGQELPALKYYDSTGSPTVTSDIFVNPYGPALVIKPKLAFLPLTSYSIRIRPELIKDTRGQPVARDINGDAVATRYDFTTEGFHGWGGALTAYEKFPGVIDVKDALVIKTTARFDYTTLNVTVKDKAGKVVETVAAPEFGTDPKSCYAVAVSPTQINIFRVTGDKRTDWTEGDYTVSIDVVAIDRRTALFSIDPFGKTPYHDVRFSAMAGIDKDKLYLAEDLLLPSECAAAFPPDQARFFDLTAPPADLATPDLTVPDLAMPDLGMPDVTTAPDAGGADLTGADLTVPDGGVAG